MLQNYLQEHPKKHLIFDFDQTIFTLILPWEIYIKELTEKLLLLDPTLADEMHGRSLNDLENEAVRRHEDMAIKIRRTYSQEFESNYLYGVEEHNVLTDFIREYAAQRDETDQPKYTFYLWTSNMLTTVEPVLIQKGLIRHFKKLVTKSDVKLTKPEIEGFYQIFDPEIHKKEDFLMVGDSINDEGAAQNAGISFFKVNHG